VRRRGRQGPTRPFAHSYWVEPGRLLAGAYPRSAADVAALGRLVSLAIDLTEENELEPYSDLLDGVEWLRAPIRDFSVPTEDEMTRILNTIDDALDRGEVVYVHCWGGRGRTGTVVGCHLVRHGSTPDAALDRIAELRRRVPDGRVPSPESTEQVAMVRGWLPGR
jgi:protein-tyrosine phosphatase